MSGCTVTPIFSDNKACSGRCRGGGCSRAPRIWVLAACDGAAALFKKQSDGYLVPLLERSGYIMSFVDGLRDRLSRASENGDFSQLVLIGSASDILWTQASLPASVSKRVVAEIEYPLMPAWFSSSSDAERLTQALRNVL